MCSAIKRDVPKIVHAVSSCEITLPKVCIVKLTNLI